MAAVAGRLPAALGESGGGEREGGGESSDEADERGRCVYDHLGPAPTYYVRAVEDYADDPDDFP